MKQAAARAAIAHVPEDAVIGVGTGSTVNFFIDELARIKGRIEAAVSSSKSSTERLRKLGIRVLDLNSVDELPVYVDGADEITRHMHMIKGGGGAQVRVHCGSEQAGGCAGDIPSLRGGHTACS